MRVRVESLERTNQRVLLTARGQTVLVDPSAVNEWSMTAKVDKLEHTGRELRVHIRGANAALVVLATDLVMTVLPACATMLLDVFLNSPKVIDVNA